MPGSVTPRQLEILSTALDGRLPARNQEEAAQLLASDPASRELYEDFDRVRQALRAAPRYRAPRSFRIRPDQAAFLRRQRRAVPVLRLSSALTGVLALVLMASPWLALRGAPLPQALSAGNGAPAVMSSGETSAKNTGETLAPAEPAPQLQAAPGTGNAPAEAAAAGMDRGSGEQPGVLPPVQSLPAPPAGGSAARTGQTAGLVLAAAAVLTGLAGRLLSRRKVP